MSWSCGHPQWDPLARPTGLCFPPVSLLCQVHNLQEFCLSSTLLNIRIKDLDQECLENISRSFSFKTYYRPTWSKLTRWFTLQTWRRSAFCCWLQVVLISRQNKVWPFRPRQAGRSHLTPHILHLTGLVRWGEVQGEFYELRRKLGQSVAGYLRPSLRTSKT